MEKLKSTSIQLVQEWKEQKTRLLEEIDEAKRFMHKMALRDDRLVKKAKNWTACDIVNWMDGSILLWFSVILSAKRDFIEYYDYPNRWEIKDFVTAYGLLFRDDYRITIDCALPHQCKKCTRGEVEGKLCKICGGRGIKYEKKGREVNLEELLEFCIEACSSKKVEVSFLDPSVQHLRKNLALAVGNQKLAAKFDII